MCAPSCRPLKANYVAFRCGWQGYDGGNQARVSRNAREPGTTTFGSWFERMGYDRLGGEEACAEMLDITVGHVRRLCRGAGRGQD